jgi:RNA-directed DNA polymerase
LALRDIIEMICTELTVPPEMVEDALRLAHIRYRVIRVKKRSGGERKMVQPSAELKLIQRWLFDHVLSKLSVSQLATAFQPGTSIVINANFHKDSRYSVRVDLKEFFPSIRRQDLEKVLSEFKSVVPPWATASGFSQFLLKACFDKEGRLPIGYPTSPCIANVVMFELDRILEQEIFKDEGRFGCSVLTRYADDFVFSTNKRGACKEFVDLLRDLLSKTPSPKLCLNEDKTRFMSRNGGSTLVTGLRITPEGFVRVHPEYRDHVRLLLKLYSLGKLKAEEIQPLRGHLAFIEHADAHLFTRLSFRYYEDIARLRHS